MERLTDHENEHYNQPGCNSCSDYRWRSCKESGEIDDCIQRLTWLRLLDIEDILGDDYDLDRLRELVETYRDGRCAPLKPGDIVTCIWYGRPTQNKVERINFYWVDDEIDWYAITTSTTGSKECFGKEEWGETVFPTYEAAEAALKGK